MQKVGIAFYTKETYEALLQEAEDQNNLHESYEDWLRDFRKMKENLRKKGILAEPFEVDLDQLRAYCVFRNLPNTGATRSQFVSDLLTKKGLSFGL